MTAQRHVRPDTAPPGRTGHPAPATRGRLRPDHGDQQPIGRRVAYWRNQRRMSQQLLADLLGRSKSWVEKIERGQRALDKYSVVHHIANVLHVDPVLLLNGHPDPGSAPAPHQPTPPAAPLNLAAARRHVDILIRHHLPPPPPGHTTDPHQTDTLRRLLTLVYAAMTAEHIEPPMRHRVIAAVCTHHLPSASTRPRAGRAHRATR